ncbi:predicted protein [Aspergillus terreus NIH2624]|uniref:Uncharacterized protein n=1 Tax=Aspergillus terreus (strain NIH 2624 / FGSC A1156) TaxID=341663 RepID=Q0C842_ASPTN|nr:uncharacterized protein ATEG_10142 [Aspergillus terreus NIH2624]EAU29591.1 predicted protein [Aspergillus terreus NIH2624]
MSISFGSLPTQPAANNEIPVLVNGGPASAAIEVTNLNNAIRANVSAMNIIDLHPIQKAVIARHVGELQPAVVIGATLLECTMAQSKRMRKRPYEGNGTWARACRGPSLRGPTALASPPRQSYPLGESQRILRWKSYANGSSHLGFDQIASTPQKRRRSTVILVVSAFCFVPTV